MDHGCQCTGRLQSITDSSTEPDPCVARGAVEGGAGPSGWSTRPEPGPLCDDCLRETGGPQCWHPEDLPDGTC